MQICKRETEKARTRCRDMAEKARRLRFHPTGRTKRMRHSAQTALPPCLTGSSGMRQRLFHGTKEALWQDGKARLATLKRRWRKAKDCKRLNDRQIAETPENGAFAAEERRMSGRRIYMEKRLYGCSHRIVSLSRRCNHGAIAVFISSVCHSSVFRQAYVIRSRAFSLCVTPHRRQTRKPCRTAPARGEDEEGQKVSGYAWSGTALHASVGGSAACQDIKKRLLRITRNRRYT